MPLRLYDTFTRSMREFQPLHAPVVGLYSCGPTVYDYAHIGNLRTYLFIDVLRRTLMLNGYAVKHILVQQRQHARAAKQWQLADQLRGQISAAGYEIEDTPRGPQVQRATARELT